MAIHIRRREFTATLGGAVAAWPFGVRAQAQHGERLRRVVFLHSLAENDPEVQIRIAAFREGIEALGWTENRNIQVEHRFSGGDFARMQAYTAELVSSAPDLIVASSSPVLAALKQATHTIPIVFSVVNDPVGQGLVASLARPGGNITGFTFIDFPMIGKWMELLKEIAPSVRWMTLMFNSQTAPYYPVFLREFGSAPASLAVELAYPIPRILHWGADLGDLSARATAEPLVPQEVLDDQDAIHAMQDPRVRTVFGPHDEDRQGGVFRPSKAVSLHGGSSQVPDDLAAVRGWSIVVDGDVISVNHR